MALIACDLREHDMMALVVHMRTVHVSVSNWGDTRAGHGRDGHGRLVMKPMLLDSISRRVLTESDAGE